MLDVFEIVFWVLLFAVGLAALTVSTVCINDRHKDAGGFISLALVLVCGLWFFAVAIGYQGPFLAQWEWMWRVWMFLIYAVSIGNFIYLYLVRNKSPINFEVED